MGYVRFLVLKVQSGAYTNYYRDNNRTFLIWIPFALCNRKYMDPDHIKLKVT